MNTLHEIFRGKAGWSIVNSDARAVLPTLEHGSCALLLTDVPYAVSQGKDEDIELVGRKAMGRHFGDWDLERNVVETRELIRTALQRAAKVIAPSGAAYVFASDVVFGAVFESLAEHLRPQQSGTLTWCKTNPAPSVRKSRWTSASELCLWASRPKHRFNFPGHAASFTWMTGPTVHHAHRTHPTEKPVWLWQRIIQAASKPGDLVLDPFCGTGSAGEAAVRLGRRFIGIELIPKYVRDARRRLEALDSVQTSELQRRGA